MLLFALLPLGGCFGGSDGDEPVGRIVEATLYVTRSSSGTVPLYTLNDGVSQMEVVAITFQQNEDDPPAVPGPEIRLMEGDTLHLKVINNNPLPHTLHLHGGLIPWEMDGVPYLTQMPIHPGQEFTYVFENLKAGTYMYHCHVDGAHHVDLGMYGAFIVEERKPKEKWDREFVLMLDEWDNCHVHGNADPVTGSEQTGEFSNRAGCLERFLQDNLAQNQLANQPRNAACSIPGLPQQIYDELECSAHGTRPPQQSNRTWWPETHPVYAPIYNTYLINGKAFPDTAPMVVREGENIKVRLLNIGEQMHSMHIHGHSMLVTHRDGYRLDHPFRVDTLGIMPGERYDVLIEADNPGFWAFHDHVSLNMMNDDHDPGGMFTCIAYDNFRGVDAELFTRSLDCVTEAMKILGQHHA
jgi:manganese oxidase